MYLCDESACCHVEFRASHWCAFPSSPHPDPQGNPSSGQVHYPVKYMAQALRVNVQAGWVTSASAQTSRVSATMGKADTGPRWGLFYAQ